MKYHNSIEILSDRLRRQLKYREWLRKQSKAKMPYKCYKKKDAPIYRKRFANDIMEQNVEIKEYRSAIKLLTFISNQ